jgi:hypothetical protein
MRRRRREAAHWKANEAPPWPVLSSPPSSSTSHSGTSSLFYCAPTSAAAFSSSTPKHTLRKLMSHVNQARFKWPARRSGWGQSGSSSSSLIMIHRHTARLIVYRSFTMPASEHSWQRRYAHTIHMHLCTFLSARTFFTSFVISPFDVVRAFRLFVTTSRYVILASVLEYFVNYGSWLTSGLFDSAILYVSRFSRLTLILCSASFSQLCKINFSSWNI